MASSLLSLRHTMTRCGRLRSQINFLCRLLFRAYKRRQESHRDPTHRARLLTSYQQSHASQPNAMLLNCPTVNSPTYSTTRSTPSECSNSNPHARQMHSIVTSTATFCFRASSRSCLLGTLSPSGPMRCLTSATQKTRPRPRPLTRNLQPGAVMQMT